MKGPIIAINIYHLDDEIQILERFERIFSAGILGRNVKLVSFDEASKFEEAIRNIVHVDVFILDIHLQDDSGDGLKIAELCRELYPSSVILICSNATDLRTIRSSLLVGANDYIAKESPPHEIVSHVAAALAERNSTDQLFSETKKVHAGSSLSLLKLRMPQLINSAVNCVYILGESGTGKEVVADFLESALPKGTPFIKVNCGSISQNLIASELFGHTKGSFTGATTEKPGLIEAANNGWIFLDEVATLPLDAQVSLLRAIDNQVIRRVGSTAERKVNFRIISATNESLSDLVAKGSFRRDLWQRLKETQIELSPLRERRHEIPELIDHFCTSMRGGPYQLAPTVLEILCNYSWKEGNIRELRNCLRAMTEKSVSGVLTPKSIPEHVWAGVDLNSSSEVAAESYDAKKTDASLTVAWKRGSRPSFENLTMHLLLEMIRDEFREVGLLSVRGLARSLGINKSTMNVRIKSLLVSKCISESALRNMVNLQDD